VGRHEAPAAGDCYYREALRYAAGSSQAFRAATMPFYTFEFVLTAVFAIFYYRAGVAEQAPGLLWASLSVATSLLIWQWLGGGILAIVAGQLALFIGITVFRVIRKSR
jgi:hypothetical protein